MEWKVDSGGKIDENLRDEILEKMEEGSLAMGDLRDYFALFVGIAGGTEDIREEMEEFACGFQINVEGRSLCWLVADHGRFAAGSGSLPSPDIVLDMDEETALGVLSGRIDPTEAYMCGDLEVEGIISDAIRFKDLLEMVLDELD